MFATASESTVRLRSPRKSIFSRPRVSRVGYSNWVMIWPSEGRRIIGTMSTRGWLDMITAQACTPQPRVRPSTPLAISTTFCTSGSSSWMRRNSPASAYRLSSGSKIPLTEMSLAITAGGRAAGAARAALGDLDHLLHVGVLVVEAADLPRLGVPLVLGVEDPLDGDVLAHHGRRQRLGEAVSHRVRVVQHARGVLERVLRLH